MLMLKIPAEPKTNPTKQNPKKENTTDWDGIPDDPAGFPYKKLLIVARHSISGMIGGMQSLEFQTPGTNWSRTRRKTQITPGTNWSRTRRKP